MLFSVTENKIWLQIMLILIFTHLKKGTFLFTGKYGLGNIFPLIEWPNPLYNELFLQLTVFLGHLEGKQRTAHQK